MNREDVNEIAKLVKQHRLAKEYTQQELSDIAGISLRSIQRIENAEVLPRLYTLKTLAKHLDFSLSESETLSKPETRKLLNRTQKILLSIGIALLLLLLACAFVFQSPHFPETAFEAFLFIAGIIAVYTVILLRVWK